jgi:prepilin-type processing-associated H-X9-DG protein
MQLHADRDPAQRFCTGAYDLKRDGCPDTWGWVADMVNMNVCRPGDLLDPSNACASLEKLNELLGGDTASPGSACPDTTRANDGTCTQLTALGAYGDSRAEFVAANFMDKGYNTNYVASWFLVRGSVKVTYNAGFETVYQTGPDGKADYKGLRNVTGPLTRRMVMNSLVPSSNIPLLGCGAPGDPSEAVAGSTIKSANSNKEYVTAGQRLTESFNDGPSQLNGASDKVLLLAAATNMDGQIAKEMKGEWDTLPWMQDTRDWWAIHAGECNILMADGSVRSFKDNNNDKYLNPGFAIATSATGDYSASGYAAGKAELNPIEIFSGLFIDSTFAQKSKNLETK